MLVVSPTSGLTTRTRLYKVSQIISNEGISIEHWGWLRSKRDMTDECPSLKIVSKKFILKGGGYNNRANKAMYIIWFFVVFFRLLFKRKSFVWALGLETAFPAVLAAFFKGHQIIFDDADRFLLIFNFPLPLKNIINLLEKFTSARSFYHVIPSKRRYNYISRKFIELKNLPTKNNIAAAKRMDIPVEVKRLAEDKLVVYVNGWLCETRGVDFLLDFISKVKSKGLSKNVLILIVGKMDSERLASKIANDFCHHIPEMKYEQALSFYRISDYVLTLYDPSIEINKFAESNKWGDALSFNVKPVINSGIVTSDFIKNIALFVDYSNSDGLVMDIEERLQGKSGVDSYQCAEILNKLTSFECGVLKIIKGKS